MVLRSDRVFPSGRALSRLDIEAADAFVLWRSNMAEMHPILWTRVTDRCTTNLDFIGASLRSRKHLPSHSPVTVNRSTRTPLFATGCTIVLVLVLALSLPLEHLAASTSRLTLIVFALVNVSLAIIKWRGGAASADTYIAPTWVPYAGMAACIGLLAADLLFLVAWTV
jgi:hypothetical protein